MVYMGVRRKTSLQCEKTAVSATHSVAALLPACLAKSTATQNESSATPPIPTVCLWITPIYSNKCSMICPRFEHPVAQRDPGVFSARHLIWLHQNRRSRGGKNASEPL